MLMLTDRTGLDRTMVHARGGGEGVWYGSPRVWLALRPPVSGKSDITDRHYPQAVDNLSTDFIHSVDNLVDNLWITCDLWITCGYRREVCG